jgi:hypothetical protein
LPIAVVDTSILKFPLLGFGLMFKGFVTASERWPPVVGLSFETRGIGEK